MKNIFISAVFFLCFLPAISQRPLTQGWHLKDHAKDGYYGISLQQAYELLSARKIPSKEVIVAILDDGIDLTHEDLEAVLWTNSTEVPGNGIDDDHNGYIDDVHGWNFLGNPDGRNVLSNSSEWIRVFWRYKEKYDGKLVDTGKLNPAEKYEYLLWQKARSGVVGKGMKQEDLKNLHTFFSNVVFCDSVLKPRFAKNEYSEKDLSGYTPVNNLETEVKKFLLPVFKQDGNPEVKNHFLLEEIEKYIIGEERRANGDKIPPEENRKTITGDDEMNFNNKYYGNNDINNAPLMHGTHLAGIIGAKRNNGIGMDGIAGNVKIMMVRTSADGDEYDKDIAMGIRYAVDNGAKIINMSFGKSLSPDKKRVDDAVKYAMEKDVLLVQAAGNSKRNIDGYDNYPNPKYFLSDSMAANWITVGASDTSGMAASFSNYGQQVVDVFAPGVAIYSTLPGSKYMSWEGTSMAAPVVTGVAAILRSYFPGLSAVEVKYIIDQSVSVPSTPTLIPGSTQQAGMNKLCKTGGIVNAFNAVKLALSYKR